MASVAREFDSASARSLATQTALFAIGTRLAVMVAAATGAYLTHRYSGSFLHGLGELAISPWARKDAGWFVHIAEDGYGPNTARTAFFPLYALIIRWVGILTLGHYRLAGMLSSITCYAGAMVLLYRLTLREAGDRAASASVVLISVFPTAFVFTAIYSESLFLLLTIGAFALADRGRWALACLAGFLAALTRSTGVILLVPLFLLYAQRRNWWRGQSRWSWSEDVRLAWLLLIPAGLATYMAYLWARFGDATLFIEAQKVTWHRSLGWPQAEMWRGLRAAYRGMHFATGHLSSLPSSLLPGHSMEVVLARTVLPFGALAFAAVCLVLAFRRLPLYYGVYALLALLIPLSEPSRLVPLYSFHRFVLVVFPLFMGLGIALQGRRVLLWTVVVLSFVLMMYLTVCFTSVNIRAHGVV